MSQWKLTFNNTNKFTSETESTFICYSHDSKSALEPFYYSEHYLNGFFILTTTLMNSLTHISNQKSTKYATCSNLKLIKVPLNYPFILICHSKFRIPQCLPSTAVHLSVQKQTAWTFVLCQTLMKYHMLWLLVFFKIWDQPTSI